MEIGAQTGFSHFLEFRIAVFAPLQTSDFVSQCLKTFFENRISNFELTFQFVSLFKIDLNFTVWPILTPKMTMIYREGIKRDPTSFF